MKEWFKYKWLQAKNVIRTGYRSYISVLVIILAFLMFKRSITLFLEKQSSWIENISHIWYGITAVFASVSYSIVQIIRFFKNNLFTSHRTFGLLLVVTFIYSYYRFFDSSFVFWGIDIKSYHFVYTDALFLPIVTLLICELIRWPRAILEKNAGIILSDEAIRDKEDDLFGYQTIVDYLLADLKLVDVSCHSFSVGIAGRWGMGKSSFLNLLEQMAISDKIVVVRFYPRSSSSRNQIQEDFLTAFSSALNKYHSDIQRYVSKYVKALKLFDKDGLVDKLSGSFDTLNIDSEKSRINQAINTIGKKVFVIIEDLDRLTGEELLEVFKLIDKNGDFCNVFYFSAYDKDYVNDVLKKVLGHEATQDYTDKYFSYEIPLPVQKSWMIQYFVVNCFQRYALVSNASFGETLINEWNKVGNSIIQQLGTIRHIKRFINLFLSRYPHVYNDVNAGDFLLLTLIRYKNINVYEALLNNRIVNRGGWLSGSWTTMYLQDNYDQILKELNCDNSLKTTIENLFPKSKEYSYGDVGFGRIRRAQSFDLYFYDQYDNRVYNKDLEPL